MLIDLMSIMNLQWSKTYVRKKNVRDTYQHTKMGCISKHIVVSIVLCLDEAMVLPQGIVMRKYESRKRGRDSGPLVTR